MKKEIIHPYLLNSISDVHRMLALPGPQHPLVSVIDFSKITCNTSPIYKTLCYNFYSICIKKDFAGKMKYGQNNYDFDAGVFTFFAPGQVVTTEVTDDTLLKGWWLLIHPDFIRNYPLAKKIKEYGFFSYAVNEALHVSEKEEAMLANITQSIEQEYNTATDTYSQDVMISHIELMLTYANRFYSRQFITRKQANNDLLINLEAILSHYFDDLDTAHQGLPTVQYVAAQLHISPSYLSDMLRALTGQNAQQHIHSKLIEKAKEILSTTSLSVSEIAYQLGFEYPQSFNKLFKNKTNQSPLEFRNAFN